MKKYTLLLCIFIYSVFNLNAQNNYTLIDSCVILVDGDTDAVNLSYLITTD